MTPCWNANDSLTLVFPDRLLTGDFLFIGEHFDSLQKLEGLDDRPLVLSAHDYKGNWELTLGEERRTNPRLGLTSRNEYVRGLANQAASAEQWMLDVVQASYVCAQDPGAAWLPVDVRVCVVGGALSLGVDGQPASSGRRRCR